MPCVRRERADAAGAHSNDNRTTDRERRDWSSLRMASPGAAHPRSGAAADGLPWGRAPAQCGWPPLGPRAPAQCGWPWGRAPASARHSRLAYAERCGQGESQGPPVTARLASAGPRIRRALARPAARDSLLQPYRTVPSLNRIHSNRPKMGSAQTSESANFKKEAKFV